jgi:hypothetical protein
MNTEDKGNRLSHTTELVPTLHTTRKKREKTKRAEYRKKTKKRKKTFNKDAQTSGV